MTIAALREILHAQRNVLRDKLQVIRRNGFPHTLGSAREEGYIEGQLAEIEMCIGLVDRLDIEKIEREQHPLRIVPSITFRSDPPWGEQQRHSWPETTFNEAEPGIDRHDPARC